MDITVNGKGRTLDEQIHIKGLLESLGLSDKRVAVELNAVIIPAASYESRYLDHGDVLEIISFVGGG